MKRLWTPIEDATLQAKYPDTPASRIAADLDRSPNAVHVRAQKLGVKKSGERKARWVYAAVKLNLTTRQVCEFAEFRRLIGAVSDSDVLRLALWHLAKHYDRDTRLWAMQGRRDPRERRTA